MEEHSSKFSIKNVIEQQKVNNVMNTIAIRNRNDGDSLYFMFKANNTTDSFHRASET